MSYLQPLGALLLIAVSVFVWKVVRNRGVWARVGAVVCIVVLGIVSAGLTLTFLFAHLMCGEYLLSPVASSDYGAVAQVTEFDCGATSPFTSYVRVRSTKSITGRFGLSRWSTVFTIEHDPRLISATWTGCHELTIRHPIPDRHPEYLKCDSVWRDVTIKCQSYVPDQAAPLPGLPEPNRWCW
jgi:hypothetical protein